MYSAAESRSDSTDNTLFGLLDTAPAEVNVLLDGHDQGALRYQELKTRALRLAHGLQANGLRRGDRLALMLPNGADWLALAFACSRLGVVVVSMNVRLGSKEIGDLIGRTECKALAYPPGYRAGATLRALRDVPQGAMKSIKLLISNDHAASSLGLPSIVTVTTLGKLEDQEYELDQQGRDGDPCMILATSGTTSRPKLVVHTQERIVRHAGDAMRALQLDSASRVLIAIPFCGAFGYAAVVMTLRAGCSIVMMDSFDADRAGELVRQYEVSHAIGTNDMLWRMLESNAAPVPFPSLRVFGHANFTPGLVDLPELAQQRGVHIRGLYGSSELLALFAAQPDGGDLSRRAAAGGIPVCPGARVRVRDSDSGELLNHQQIGQLEVLAPNSMIKYLGDPETTANAFTDDDYLRTGDLACTLEDGGFMFASRAKDILRIGGYLVAPEEIEDVIRVHGSVTACQVVAVTQSRGVRPVAFVVAEADAEIDVVRLREACRDNLATYKVPVRIFVLDQLPMISSPNGLKVQKNVLRNMAEELLQQES